MLNRQLVSGKALQNGAKQRQVSFGQNMVVINIFHVASALDQSLLGLCGTSPGSNLFLEAGRMSKPYLSALISD
jgi:hypothetical protein